MGKNTKKSKDLRDDFFQADIQKKFSIQKGFCPYRDCKKIHGKKLPLTITAESDHIIPPKIWRCLEMPGDPNSIENLDILHRECHGYKTAEDRKLLALYKKYSRNTGILKKARGCSRSYKDPSKIRDCLIKTFNNGQKK